MNKILHALFICCLIISCSTAPIEPTQKQKEFAHKLLETPGILKAEWYNSISLEVTVDLEKLGMNPELKAKQLADQIASMGYSLTDKGLCVSIYYPNLNKLASTCVN